MEPPTSWMLKEVSGSGVRDLVMRFVWMEHLPPRMVFQQKGKGRYAKGKKKGPSQVAPKSKDKATGPIYFVSSEDEDDLGMPAKPTTTQIQLQATREARERATDEKKAVGIQLKKEALSIKQKQRKQK